MKEGTNVVIVIVPIIAIASAIGFGFLCACRCITIIFLKSRFQFAKWQYFFRKINQFDLELRVVNSFVCQNKSGY